MRWHWNGVWKWLTRVCSAAVSVLVSVNVVVVAVPTQASCRRVWLFCSVVSCIIFLKSLMLAVSVACGTKLILWVRCTAALISGESSTRGGE
ncbi:hypothetical protein KC19_11G018900 [Ceratodon purpureus]|uniref:Secreted peptide n=1 Tax=Ceratodon purpureus TaxID=3225 RepID=A0A8T0GD51_CERPU|nr:hypothetical protein KC19_11G018900 [Ceratodon purpureus]